MGTVNASALIRSVIIPPSCIPKWKTSLICQRGYMSNCHYHVIVLKMPWKQRLALMNVFDSWQHTVCSLRIETMCLNCRCICRLTLCSQGGKVHILYVDAEIADSFIDQAVYCADRKIQTKWLQLYWYANAFSKSSMSKDRESPLLIPKMTALYTIDITVV